MAHSFDTKVRFTGNANPLTQAYTCGAGTTLLVVAIVSQGGSTAARLGSGPTYNGLYLSRAVSVLSGAATETTCQIWYLLMPPTGAEYTISIPNTRPNVLCVCASSYKAQSGKYTVLDSATSAISAGAADPSLTITPAVNGDVLVAVCGDGYADPPTGRTHTTLYETDMDSYSDNHQYALVADTSATAVGWTVASDDYVIALAAFKESDSRPLLVCPSSQDTYIDSNAATTNYGTGTTVLLYPYVTAKRRALFTFDASALDGRTVTLATLTLYATAVSSGRTITVYRLLRGDWVEEEATWNIYKTGSNWGTSGALNSSTDYTATDAATSASLAANGEQSWDVTNIVHTATTECGGLVHLLVVDDGASASKAQQYASHENTNLDLLPRLYIEYTVPGPSFVPQCIFL